MDISSILGTVKAIWDGAAKLFAWREKRIEQKKRLLSPPVQIVKRFVWIFDAHEITRAEIPRFLSQKVSVKLSDVLDDNRLLERLDEDLLNYTCSRFGVSREWLDRGDVEIYPWVSVYQSPHGLLDFLKMLESSGENPQGYCFKTTSNRLDKSYDNHEPIYLFFRSQIGLLGDKPIYRYFPVDELWPWGHPPARIFLKAIALLCIRRNIYIHCRHAREEDIEAVSSGEQFPSHLLNRVNGPAWHLDDYVLLPHESQVAKDEEEALEVREYLKTSGVPF